MIIFVRHGQTSANISNRICGSGSDILLNENGEREVKETAEKLKKVKIDIVFCSPMLRAFQTAREILMLQKNMPPIYLDKRLTERD